MSQSAPPRKSPLHAAHKSRHLAIQSQKKKAKLDVQVTWCHVNDRQVEAAVIRLFIDVFIAIG